MKQRGILAPDPELLADSSPIRRQLLGGMGDNSHPLGSNPEAGPISQFWWHSQRSHTVFIVPARVAGTLCWADSNPALRRFTNEEERVPLKTWAEERGVSDFGLGKGTPRLGERYNARFGFG